MNGARAGLLAFVFASALAGAARADPTTEECIDANAKAQALRRAGNLRHARENLLLCASASCPKMVRDDCTQRMDEVDRLTPTIVFQAKDAQGHDLSDVKVEVDGAPFTDRLVGTPLQVDVGEHTFSFSAEGFTTTTQKYVIVEGQKDRHETVTLPSNVVVPPTPPPPEPPPIVTPPVFVPPPMPVPVRPYVPPPPAIDPAVAAARQGRRTAGIVMTVFGVLSLGGTVAFGVLGGQQNATITSGGFQTSNDIASADSTGQAYNVGLGVTLVGGIILLAVGVPLWLTSLGDGAPVRVGARGLSFTW